MEDATYAAFEVVAQLARSPQGVVLLAVHRSSGTRCVLKGRRAPELPGKGREQLEHELRVLAVAAHPLVVRCLGHFWHAETGMLFLVLEHAPLGDLNQLLEQRRRLAQPLLPLTMWSVFHDVCAALAACHERGIVHRDVKAMNVLLFPRAAADGLGPSEAQISAKLGDFGVSALCGAQQGDPMMTTFTGTPLYLSPELLQRRAYDARADCWALGVLLYHMAALQPPFTGPSLPALSARICRADYSPLAAAHTDAAAAQRLVSALLCVDARRRLGAAQARDAAAARLAQLADGDGATAERRTQGTTDRPQLLGRPSARLPSPLDRSAPDLPARSASPPTAGTNRQRALRSGSASPLPRAPARSHGPGTRDERASLLPGAGFVPPLRRSADGAAEGQPGRVHVVRVRRRGGGEHRERRWPDLQPAAAARPLGSLAPASQEALRRHAPAGAPAGAELAQAPRARVRVVRVRHSQSGVARHASPAAAAATAAAAAAVQQRRGEPAGKPSVAASTPSSSSAAAPAAARGAGAAAECSSTEEEPEPEERHRRVPPPDAAAGGGGRGGGGGGARNDFASQTRNLSPERAGGSADHPAHRSIARGDPPVWPDLSDVVPLDRPSPPPLGSSGTRPVSARDARWERRRAERLALRLQHAAQQAPGASLG